MSKFIVTIRECHTQDVLVEAVDAVEARLKVMDGDGQMLNDTLEYSHTLPPDTWTVASEISEDLVARITNLVGDVKVDLDAPISGECETNCNGRCRELNAAIEDEDYNDDQIPRCEGDCDENCNTSSYAGCDCISAPLGQHDIDDCHGIKKEHKQ